MEKATNKSNAAGKLRKRAEGLLSGKPVDISGLSADDISALVHDLQVHQAELEIQNTELRELQDELEASRDQYAGLYNFAPVGYCTINRKGKILFVNQAMKTMLGISQADIAKQAFITFVATEDRDRYYLYMRRAIKGETSFSCDLRLIRASGDLVFVRLESMVVKSDPDQIMIMLVDMTHQRELQSRTIEQRELERKKMARDLHDGPVQELAAINFNLQLIMLTYPNPDLARDLRAVQDKVREQIDTLRQLSMDLRPPVLSRMGLDFAIRSHLDMLVEKNPQIIFRTELAPIGNLAGEAGSVALFRIFQEAVINAIKHAASRETIEVWIRLSHEDHQVRLEVQDSGPGFELPDDWLQLAREGHLGLVGMRERAEAVGGTLEVQTQPNKGTMVITTLPVRPKG